MGMKPVKKAWRLNPSKIDEEWYYNDTVVYADGEKEARVLMLDEVKHTNLELLSGEEPNYITIPIKREKNWDKFLYEGRELTLHEIEKFMRAADRMTALNLILANSDIDWCYIMKGSYYYRDNSSGYSEYVLNAGVYDKARAVSEARSCEELTVIPIEIEKHNANILSEINRLSSRIIIPLKTTTT